MDDMTTLRECKSTGRSVPVVFLFYSTGHETKHLNKKFFIMELTYLALVLCLLGCPRSN